MRTADRRIALGLYRTGHTRRLLEGALEQGVTDLDTAFNYHRFDSHRTLAAIAGDLLPAFTISTKVGYFPDGHDLDPARIRAAVEQSVEELGRSPDTVLLHNPESSVEGFTDASAALLEMREAGLFKHWGFSTWDPRRLLEADWEIPRPDVAMVRAGLTVSVAILNAVDELVDRAKITELWGMAPFAGNADDSIWRTVDMSTFLVSGQQGTALQAGIATAFAIPEVARLAVGTSHVEHLAEAVGGSRLEVNTERVTEYRALLRERATLSAGSPSRKDQ
ncbi:aldo/keto reductase [Streptomyces sp. ME19-01-6]|uniref:aldo/keto reductase n=1 Tax=Streptomyces sp. ME19-01-6 TaxID=3028686 RepID=UPI0029AAC16F|nr:aldo/keto reductase [Streptomyces sp. ME19-01-6]MDX3224528.1 aldo/keto reductase [Streptomyces sp. ME19-01-6]